MSNQGDQSGQDLNGGANVSATTPLLENENKQVQERPVIITSVETSGAPHSPTVASPASPSKQERPLSQTIANEYRFVHLRIPPKEGKLKFLLPVLLLNFQLIFIILFGLFADYNTKEENNQAKYPLFIDLHAMAVLGFGFIMTFLKRYGYGSVGFNLLLVAFVIQWALIFRGWIHWGTQKNGMFNIGLENLIHADFTVIAILISFGAVLGKTTLTQLVVLAIIEVVVQVYNEHLNMNIIKTYDVGRSVYVHLFGAVFGLAVSKLLHFKGVHSSKQAPVYHSDLFCLIGTLFLWVYYPSFNGLFAYSPIAQTKATINTLAAISASCIVTFGISSLAGKGKLNVLHVQHATIAGGIAIGSVVDLNVQVYIALIVGSVAGFFSTIGYQYIDPFVTRVLKLHDTCSVQSLHGLPGLIAALLGAIFAACSSFKEYGQALYTIYPARLPIFNSTEYLEQDLNQENGIGRSGWEQAGFQLIGLLITIGIALVSGALTGIILRLPFFEQLTPEVEMFDDEAQWLTPDDYALKLTFASTSEQQPQQQPQQNSTPEAKEDSKV